MRWGVAVALALAGTVAGCSLSSKPKPVEPKTGATQEGIASWYGPGFHGRRTANGEVYNQYDLTAAHQTLPHGTQVRVTNLTNGRAVEVRINDRGPFVDDRIIDLSYSAAREIGMIGPGTAPVRLEILGPEWSNPVQVAVAALPPPVPPPPPPPRSKPAQRAEIVAELPPASRYDVQVGAFSDYDRARRTQRNLESQGARAKLALVEEAGVRYYRLRIGPFTQQAEAVRAVERINALGYPALIVADRASWQ
jgi:rare lipoprotein A